MASHDEFIKHAQELRLRVALCVLALVVASSAAWILHEEIYRFLISPLVEASDGQQRRMIYTGLSEAFFTYVKLSVFAGFIIAFPYISYQLYSFVAPALYRRERRVAMVMILSSPLLFALGGALAFYGIFPLAWEFFLSFESGGDGQTPIILEARVSEYLSLSVRIILGFGIAFQLPLVMMILLQTGVLRISQLRSGRKYALIAAVIAAAILTPPDVISQIGLALPLYLLYEGTILVARFMIPTRQGNA